MNQDAEKTAQTISRTVSVMLLSMLAAGGGTLLWSNREAIQSQADNLLDQVSFTKYIKDQIQPTPLITPDQFDHRFNDDMLKAVRESWNFKPPVQSIPQPTWVPPPMQPISQPTWAPPRFHGS
jgi:hypothetical protein